MLQKIRVPFRFTFLRNNIPSFALANATIIVGKAHLHLGLDFKNFNHAYSHFQAIAFHSTKRFSM
jgi:hypothetical protein